MKINQMKMKRWLPVLAVALALFLLWFFVIRQGAPQPPAFGVELLKNGGFEQVDADGYPDHWLPEAYFYDANITSFQVEDGKDGKGILIQNASPNDARYFQTVKVSPNTIYHFSGDVKASAEGGRGANLSIADVYVFSEAVFDTEDGWQRVDLYGKTGSKQTDVTLFARLGGYSGEAVGEARFDNLSLMAVSQAPDNVIVTNWEKAAQSNSAASKSAGASTPFAPLAVMIFAVFAMLLVSLARVAQRQEEALNQPGMNNKANVLLAVLLAFAFVTRLLLANMVSGFPVDIGAFRAWAQNMADAGPSGFYLLDGHRDYPPGYMLVLWPLGLIGRMLGSGVTGLMVKLPSLICDLLIITLLYRVAKRHVNSISALVLSMLYAMNPLTYLAGAAWGQVDSLPSLLLMLAVLLIIDKRWRFALPVYVLAVLMKPQALMVGPLGLLALVMDFIWRKEEEPLQDMGLGVLFSLLVLAAGALPFFNQTNGIPWLFGLYGNTMRYYNYATVNATNLYFLFGQNWVGISNAAPFLLRLSGSLVMLVPLIVLAVQKHKNQSESLKTNRLELFSFIAAMLPALAVLLPMSFQVMGTLLMVSVFLAVGSFYISGKHQTNLPLLASVLLIGFSLLGTMMHERYLFLAVALLTLAYVLKRDRRILFMLLAVSAVCFLNTAVALDRGMRIGGSNGNLDAPMAGLVSDSAWLEYALAFISLPLVSVSIYLAHALSRQGEIVRKLHVVQPVKEMHNNLRFAFVKKREQVRFDRKDALLIVLVTVLYAVVALVNLGATQAPQNAWVSSRDQQEVRLDLGESRTFRLMFYGGIHWSDSTFEVGVSEDGETYTDYPFQITQGGLFAWKPLGHPFINSKGETEYDSLARELSGRYVRISNITNTLTLMELVAQDYITGENLAFQSTSPGAEALIDEQAVFQGSPSWFNSMYFDEIYHARTAYEQRNGLLGLEPSHIYEVSHPPLGKVFMTFSVMLFGMTPFGWRFAGAFAGVLMLPGMYLLGKQLTKRRGLGMLSTLLMAFDFMHFTQTRIATIDSFVTLFIIYAYFFMLRYTMQDPLRTPLKKRVLMLFFSGFFMGLSIASKWPGMYAGAGLAVLFFASLIIQSYQGYLLSKATNEELDALGEDAAPARAFAESWLRQALLTCLWCIPFFILVPAAIYVLSYIPVYSQSPGGLTLQKIIDNNVYMFGYHSEPGRGSDHPWASPWFSWPIIKKPMYFYSGGIKDGTASVIWSFGNPLVWWGGLVGLVLTALYELRQRMFVTRTLSQLELAEKGIPRYDRRPVFLLMSFLAQYLPWVLVPRGTYIYHYFPSVPFIILCLALMLDVLAQRKEKMAKILWIALPAVAFILFVTFFPYISGVRVSTAWLEAMKWFPGWLYY